MLIAIARATALGAFATGVLSLIALLASPGPLRLCSLTDGCITANLSGRMYFWGDSPAATIFNLRLVLAPLTVLLASLIMQRSIPGAVLLLAGISVAAVGLPQIVGTYALVPLHPIVFALSLATLITVAFGAWRSSHS